MQKWSQFSKFILENYLVIFFIISGLEYFLGGFDETIITLMFLNLVDLLLGAFSEKKRKGIVYSKLKMYLMVAVGVMIDKSIGMTDIKLRAYIILLYSYHELESILKFLKEDKNLPVPKKLRAILRNIKNKDKE